MRTKKKPPITRGLIHTRSYHGNNTTQSARHQSSATTNSNPKPIYLSFTLTNIPPPYLIQPSLYIWLNISLGIYFLSFKGPGAGDRAGIEPATSDN